MQNIIDRQVEQILPEIIALRRGIHQFPEIGLDTQKTAGTIAQYLQAVGIPIHTAVEKAGVVAFIEGNTPGPCLLLRADMDGLPLTEATGLDYASTIKGKMHACGHDMHAAALAGVAKIIWQLRDQLQGNLQTDVSTG